MERVGVPGLALVHGLVLTQETNHAVERGLGLLDAKGKSNASSIAMLLFSPCSSAGCHPAEIANHVTGVDECSSTPAPW